MGEICNLPNIIVFPHLTLQETNIMETKTGGPSQQAGG